MKEVIFEIDVSAMKRDGYMPTVSMEDPLENYEYKNALAYKIGFENYSVENEYYSEGLRTSTIVFYGNIPSKYIRECQ